MKIRNGIKISTFAPPIASTNTSHNVGLRLSQEPEYIGGEVVMEVVSAKFANMIFRALKM